MVSVENAPAVPLPAFPSVRVPLAVPLVWAMYKSLLIVIAALLVPELVEIEGVVTPSFTSEIVVPEKL